MWLIWVFAIGAGLLGAPWYGPAAISFVFAVAWFAMVTGAATFTPEAAVRLGIVIGAIFAVWGIGRGMRYLALRWRQTR